MELKEYLGISFDGLARNMGRVLNGLTQQELAWRPAYGCNSIGLILLHMARFEDNFLHAKALGKTEAWESGKWFKMLNLAENESGSHYTAEQVCLFQVPEQKDLVGYYEAVRKNTLDYLKTAKPEAFDKKVTMPFFGEMTVGAVFSIVTGHQQQHIGEISYLRGLQRGIDK